MVYLDLSTPTLHNTKHNSMNYISVVNTLWDFKLAK